MSSYGDVKDLAVGIIDDADGSDTGSDLHMQALKAALRAILPWCAPRQSSVLTFQAEAITIDLPTDIYDIDAVVEDETGEVLSEITFSPGAYVGENVTGNNWMIYPSGTLRFSKSIESGNTITVFYRSYWAEPSAVDAYDEALDIPEYAVLAVAYYMAAYMLNPSATQTSKLNPYKTKVDSGNPEHNPISEQISFLMKLFMDEINRFPPLIKGTR